MNSVSMPSRPAARAWAASSGTTPLTIPGIYGVGVRRPPVVRVLVGPVTVLGEVGARLVLLVALAVAAHADPVEQVDQPHRQTGRDEQGPALQATLAEPSRGGDGEAGDDDRHREPGAHELHVHAASKRSATEKRSTSSAGVRRSPRAHR